MTYSPSALVVAFWLVLVATFVTVTAAAGMTARFWSKTAPTIRPDSTWANAVAESSRNAFRATTVRRSMCMANLKSLRRLWRVRQAINQTGANGSTINKHLSTDWWHNYHAFS